MSILDKITNLFGGKNEEEETAEEVPTSNPEPDTTPAAPEPDTMSMPSAPEPEMPAEEKKEGDGGGYTA